MDNFAENYGSSVALRLSTFEYRAGEVQPFRFRLFYAARASISPSSAATNYWNLRRGLKRHRDIDTQQIARFAGTFKARLEA